MPAIKANNIEKYYQSADKELVHALENISLTVNDGEFVAIGGPYGCGKSTFLEIVAGLLSADGGEPAAISVLFFRMHPYFHGRPLKRTLPMEWKSQRFRRMSRNAVSNVISK